MFNFLFALALVCARVLGPDQRVAYLRKENNVLRSYIVAQQQELDKFEHNLNQAIEVSSYLSIIDFAAGLVVSVLVLPVMLVLGCTMSMLVLSTV